MNRLAIPLLLASVAMAAPALAQSQIGTIERGRYFCELPGDAGGAAGIPQPQENFRIISASRYTTADGRGTYLRRGDRLTMTSGPRNGDSYVIQGTGFLRKIENGEASRLRCVRQGR